MPVIRAFIAVDLSPKVIRGLDTLLKQLKERLPGDAVRWVPAGNIHLTLKFLGDVSLANLEILKKMLQGQASSHRSFEIQVGGIGAFPNIRRPRVVWVGVEAPQELGILQRSIDAETNRLGYASEEREFSPHLTLGRVSRNATPQDARRISDVLGVTNLGIIANTPIQAVHLYRSDLNPAGSVYTKIFSAPLLS